MKKLLLSVVVIVSLLASAARAEDRFANPIDVLVADPFIYREDDTYYLYGTADRSGLLVWTSDDLVDWRLRGHAFERSRETWSRQHFWAPELFKHNDKYYLHFTAQGRAPGEEKLDRQIVLAEGDSPLGPFREIRAPWFKDPMETIDSHVFKDEDGQLYLYAVGTGTPDKPIFNINVRKLNDRLEIISDATVCTTPTFYWEGGVVNEGPFILKKDDTYVLTYSANGYHDPNYCLGIATSKSPLGPWDKHNATGAILHRSPTISGPGHHCFVDSPDGKEMFVAYHTHQHLDKPGPPRQLAIDRVEWAQGVDPVKGTRFPTLRMRATTAPQQLPAGADKPLRGQSDEFDGSELNRELWTLFSEGLPRRPNWSLADGRLTILTEDGDVYQDRSDLSNLFLQYAPKGDFDVMTRVAIAPENDFEQAFLCLWQDHHHFAKLAYVHSRGGRKVEVGVERAGKFDSHLHDIPGLGDELHLRIKRTGDKTEFLISSDGIEWKSIESQEIPLTDLRVGLGACSPDGPRSIPASFDYLRFK